MLDRLPFWKRYFAELGMETVLSPVTDPRISAGGIELSVAEPCYPVQPYEGRRIPFDDHSFDVVFRRTFWSMSSMSKRSSERQPAS